MAALIRVNEIGPCPYHIRPMPAPVPTLVLAARPALLPASVLPVVVGAAWAMDGDHGLRVLPAVVTAGALLCVQVAANMANDVCDHLGGSDRPDQGGTGLFNGGSRVIQQGRMGWRALALWAVCFLVLGGIGIAMLGVWAGWPAAVTGLVITVLALSYSLPPLRLASRGLGEAAAAACAGLAVLLAQWVQAGAVGLSPVLAAAAMGCWTAASVVCAEVPDRAADASAGKRTQVVRMGEAGAPPLFLAMQAVAAAHLLALGWLSELPPWAALPPLLFMVAALAAAPLMGRPRGQGLAIGLAVTIHAMGAVWLALAALI